MFGLKTPGTAELLRGIGEIYLKKGKFSQAVEYLQLALSIQSIVLKEDDSELVSLKNLVKEAKEKEGGKDNSPYATIRELFKKATIEKKDQDVVLKFTKKEDAKNCSSALNDQQSLFAALNPDQLKVCQQTTETAMETIYLLTLPEDVYNDLKTKISK